jgi:hypothetical protein
MHLAVQIAGAVAWLAVLAGCFLLHVRLRNIFSASFLLSIIAIAAWMFWGQAALHSVMTLPALTPTPTAGNVGQGNNAAQALAGMGQSQTAISVVESVLIIWIGVSFFLAIKSIRSQGVA